MSDARLDAIRDAFDRRAADYDESAMHRELANVVAEFVDLSGVHDVLDVATGTGLVLRALHRIEIDLRLTGVDISPGMLGVAREHLPEATWIEADSAAVPVSDRSMDLITCVTALHAIPHTRTTLAEWRRVLRPDGRVVTATFLQRRNDNPALQRIPYPSDHVPFSSLVRLRQTAADAGFRIPRSTAWTDGGDALLIAEWRPAG